MRVGKTLGLNVARLLEIFLDETFAATECRDCFTSCRVKQFGDFFLLVGNLDSSTTTTERSLDGNRQSVLCNELENFFCTGNRIDGSGGEWCANFFCNVTSRNFIAELFDCLWRWADPNQAGFDNRASEICVFCQKAVAGVNRVCARLACNGDDLFDNQIGLGAGCAVQRIGFVGELHVHRIAVLVGIDSDRENARVFGCSRDANCDFAAVGDENLGDFFGWGSHTLKPIDQKGSIIGSFSQQNRDFVRKTSKSHGSG